MDRQHDGPDCHCMRIALGDEHTPRGNIEHDEVYAE